MRIGFDCGLLNERGTSVAIYDYAFYARELLSYEPVVFFDAATPPAPSVHERFRQQFELVPYEGESDYQRQTGVRKVEVLYCLKAGGKDSRLSQSAKNAVHCVFQHFEPHGDVYAYISQWLANRMTGGLYPHVPHIVTLPEPSSDMRAALGIPKDALVAGRHGGFTQFNLKFARKAVLDAVNKRKDLYFLFLNTAQFCAHERVIFLPAIVDPLEKSNFINTCDVMVHARSRGETFGLAMAEFMYFGKPVFSWAGGLDRNHLALLPDKGAAYKTYGDLLRLLTSFEKTAPDEAWKRMVAPFSPQSVMAQFKQVFIDAPPQDLSARPPIATVLKKRLVRRLLKARYDLWREGIRI